MPWRSVSRRRYYWPLRETGCIERQGPAVDRSCNILGRHQDSRVDSTRIADTARNAANDRDVEFVIEATTAHVRSELELPPLVF